MKSARRSGASWVGLSISMVPLADYNRSAIFVAFAGKIVASIVLYIVRNKDFRKGVRVTSRTFSTLILCPPEVSPMDGDAYSATPFNSPQNRGFRRLVLAGSPITGIVGMAAAHQVELAIPQGARR
jgi:hypothetical protein